MPHIYLNGRYLSDTEAKIDPSDRGFLLSDGLFETIRIYQGKPFALEEHWGRLVKSAKILDIPIPLVYEQLEKIVTDLIVFNVIKAGGVLRLTMTRGTGPRGLNYPAEIKPTILVAVFPLAEHVISPAKIKISSIRRNEYSPLANIKSLAYFDNVLARNEAIKGKFDEAILRNTQGNIAEASAANVFIVTLDNIVVTPSLSDGALPGITRQIVLELARNLNISTEERSIPPAELLAAKEVFLTNSIIEIQAVQQIQDRVFSCDTKTTSITPRLQMAYKMRVADAVEEKRQSRMLSRL